MKALIYTDARIDGLCALEYISRYFSEATIILCDEQALESATNASAFCKSQDEFVQIVNRWFRSCEVFNENEPYVLWDEYSTIFCFASCGSIVQDLESEIILRYSDLCLVAGTTAGPDGWKYESRANSNVAAYQAIFELSTSIYQFPLTWCRAQKGFPTRDLNFFIEYVSKSRDFDCSTYCPALLGSAYFIDSIRQLQPLYSGAEAKPSTSFVKEKLSSILK